MGKRIKVKYLGESLYYNLKTVDTGTIFSAVLATDYGHGHVGVFIRGSNLQKAAGVKGLFPAKQYLFVTGRKNSEMEII